MTWPRHWIEYPDRLVIVARTPAGVVVVEVSLAIIALAAVVVAASSDVTWRTAAACIVIAGTGALLISGRQRYTVILDRGMDRAEVRKGPRVVAGGRLEDLVITVRQTASVEGNAVHSLFVRVKNGRELAICQGFQQQVEEARDDLHAWLAWLADRAAANGRCIVIEEKG
jgi:hypothetical protein